MGLSCDRPLRLMSRLSLLQDMPVAALAASVRIARICDYRYSEKFSRVKRKRSYRSRKQCADPMLVDESCPGTVRPFVPLCTILHLSGRSIQARMRQWPAAGGWSNTKNQPNEMPLGRRRRRRRRRRQVHRPAKAQLS
ncbi:hypothetical protein BKA81DRAFT_45918 [Phyllosticta paracitricarpa]|uniref:Uncharacterized protein n=1 Tax=Phyllosticta paracitricarpa TaxID=2016321 RepID=A0ABR1MZF4_9PEZI